MAESVYMRRIRELTAKLNEQDLDHERNQRLQIIFHHSPVGLFLVAPDCRIVAANPTGCELLGYNELELMGMRFVDVPSTPEEIERNERAAKAIREGAIDRYTVLKQYVKPNGATVRCRLSVHAVRDLHGKFLYGIGVLSPVETDH